ncbi:PP2C family protein-serine/threonine phosphatase [Cohnella caldifontis]|uniref:PP2C family protein-serine/threonine phosphatase n=1 Tax=Cohnella caldifontis TaxID=3027471 RepID=UPI0023ECCC37|nr:fused response regulator/phosphatase [Cohnella sp. YIM B05605]
MRVLIVDDNAMNVMVIQEMMKRAGYAKISVAYSAEEMFRLLESPDGGESIPGFKIDLILLDMMMPVMDGIEACRLLQADSRFRDIPVIMVTAIGDSRKLAEALDAGATDFVTKPINKTELLARIRSALRLKSELDWHKERDRRLREELHLARQVQEAVLPANAEERGLSVRAFFRSSEELAGDLYAWHRGGERRWAFAVIDAMGHGISSALVSMFAASVLKEAMQELWTPSKVFREVNRRLMGIRPDNELVRYFCTGIYVTLDLDRGVLEYANAGHPPGFVFAGNGQRPERLGATSAPLGMFEGLEYQAESRPIRRGDRLYLFTDGILGPFEGEDEERIGRLSEYLLESSGEAGRLEALLDQVPLDGRSDDRCLVKIDMG